LELFVTDEADEPGGDHASWAGAYLRK